VKKKSSILIVDCPHDNQQYNTLDDWQFTDRGLTITVSDTGDLRYNALLVIHGLVEALLCKAHGITTEEVDAYDLKSKDDDPGLNPKAPYHDEHMTALKIEYDLAARLGVDKKKYDKVQENLCNNWRKE
jgi:hypothetical protein